MVVASPAVILMDASIYTGFNAAICAAAVIALAVGILIALKLGDEPGTAAQAKKDSR